MLGSSEQVDDLDSHERELEAIEPARADAPKIEGARACAPLQLEWPGTIRNEPLECDEHRHPAKEEAEQTTQRTRVGASGSRLMKQERQDRGADDNVQNRAKS